MPLDGAWAGGYLIQAGSFRSEDNAERARSLLGGIAPVEVAPTQAGGEIFCFAFASGLSPTRRQRRRRSLE